MDTSSAPDATDVPLVQDARVGIVVGVHLVRRPLSAFLASSDSAGGAAPAPAAPADPPVAAAAEGAPPVALASPSPISSPEHLLHEEGGSHSSPSPSPPPKPAKRRFRHPAISLKKAFEDEDVKDLLERFRETQDEPWLPIKRNRTLPAPLPPVVATGGGHAVLNQNVTIDEALALAEVRARAVDKPLADDTEDEDALLSSFQVPAKPLADQDEDAASSSSSSASGSGSDDTDSDSEPLKVAKPPRILRDGSCCFLLHGGSDRLPCNRCKDGNYKIGCCIEKALGLDMCPECRDHEGGDRIELTSDEEGDVDEDEVEEVKAIEREEKVLGPTLVVDDDAPLLEDDDAASSASEESIDSYVTGESKNSKTKTKADSDTDSESGSGSGSASGSGSDTETDKDYEPPPQPLQRLRRNPVRAATDTKAMRAYSILASVTSRRRHDEEDMDTEPVNLLEAVSAAKPKPKPTRVRKPTANPTPTIRQEAKAAEAELKADVQSVLQTLL